MEQGGESRSGVMLCAVRVVKQNKKDENGEELFSVVNGGARTDVHGLEGLAADIPREDEEVYAIIASRTSLGVLPREQPRNAIDGWIDSLLEHHRVRRVQ